MDRAAEAEQKGQSAVAEALAAAQGGGDPNSFLGIIGNEWASPEQRAVAQALYAKSQPDYQTFESNGDIYRYNQNDPNSKPSMFFDAPDAPAQPDYGFMIGPDGSLIRTDKTSGTAESVGQYAKPADPGFRLLTPEEAKASNLDPNKAWQMGPDNRVYEVGGGGVNVNVGGEGQRMGTIPPGMAAVVDPTNPSGFRLEPIPGGPAAAEQQAAGVKAAATEGNNAIATDTITNAAALARDLASKPLTTGIAGGLAANLSESDAAELRRQVNVLTSNATIQNLNAMRQASPTGGALGSVTEKENAMLAAAAGAIDPNSKPEDFRRQLDNYERTLLRIINGPEAGDRIFEETRKKPSADDPAIWEAPAPPPNWGGKPNLWEFMTPEQRALWK